MKRKLIMDPAEFSDIKKKGSMALVERNTQPQGVNLVNAFRVARSEPSDLVELAKEIQKADTLVRSTTCGKLQVIAEQVRFLQEQARRVLLEARQNTSLHHAACNFRKMPGHVYHLYRRQSGQQYFSMLSEQDWGNSPPHAYIGSYRLEQDQSWTPENKMAARTEEISMLDKIFSASEKVCVASFAEIMELEPRGALDSMDVS
uniref:Uncharacterized protein n=1 Tax=Timema cristinae TaxID=61476 RepID=A0A7R9H9H0_TIMCR|nr:unnamed protein product [Timema cristinae]